MLDVHEGRHWRMPLGRLAGIPIEVHYSWLVAVGLLTWSLSFGFASTLGRTPAWVTLALALVTALLFFASILLHEIGHAVVARREGLTVRSVTLFVFGGIARLEGEPRDARSEMRLAAAGPVVTLVLIAGAWIAAVWPDQPATVRSVLDALMYANLAVLIFNLLPVLPLDGGRLLRAALWTWLGRERATAIAAGAGHVLAAVLVLVGILAVLSGAAVAGFWYVLVGWFLERGAASAAAEARLEGRLGSLTVGDVMVHDPVTVHEDAPLAEAIERCVIANGFGAYPVMRAGAPVGLLRLRDLLQVSAERRREATVGTLMVPLADSMVVAPERPLFETLRSMAEAGDARRLVVDQGRLVGLLTLSAVARQLRAREWLRERPRAA